MSRVFSTAIVPLIAVALNAGCASRSTVADAPKESDAATLVHLALRQASKSAYERQWDGALRKLQWILMVDPEYRFAQELRSQVQEWRETPPTGEALVYRLETWAQRSEQGLPEELAFHPAQGSAWRILKSHPDAPTPPEQRQPTVLSAAIYAEEWELYSNDADIYRSLQGIRITLKGGTTFSSLVDGIRELTGLTFFLDHSASELSPADCPVDCDDEPLAEVFSRLLPPLDLAIRVKYGALIIGKR